LLPLLGDFFLTSRYLNRILVDESSDSLVKTSDTLSGSFFGPNIQISKKDKSLELALKSSGRKDLEEGPPGTRLSERITSTS